MDSKAGVALQWLRSSRTGKVQVANLIKLVQGLNKDEIIQNKVHRSITQNTLEHGKIVLEYYPRGRNIHKFEIELPPVYEHVDLGREFFSKSLMFLIQVSADKVSLKHLFLFRPEN